MALVGTASPRFESFGEQFPPFRGGDRLYCLQSHVRCFGAGRMSEHDRGTLSSMSDGLNLMDVNTEMPRVTRMLATSAKVWTTISLMDKQGLGSRVYLGHLKVKEWVCPPP